MERDARDAVCQIVRYERVHGLIMIKEGEEPTQFWDAFSNLLPLIDKSGNKVEVGESVVKICPGESKVDAYNVDFEIFLKAIMGGFVPPFASTEDEHETHLPVRESSWSMLRHKFASGVINGFVLAPKVLLSRAYSDSMMIVHASSPSSISFSSPPYLSPDSISSDSSTCSQYFSESSVDSPSAVSCSLPISSTLSNLSLVSSQTSSHPKSNSLQIVRVILSFQPCSQIASSPLKKDNDSTSSSYESNIEIVFDSKLGVRNGGGYFDSRFQFEDISRMEKTIPACPSVVQAKPLSQAKPQSHLAT
ncbi:hypothetical protein CRYUN_Cryun08bG0111700 [Craigia yunnanensis]